VVAKAGQGNKRDPILDDSVDVLPRIGPETVTKLKDLAAVATTQGHSIPFTDITTGNPILWDIAVMRTGITNFT
jgi:hypothetical protein